MRASFSFVMLLPVFVVVFVVAFAVIRVFLGGKRTGSSSGGNPPSVRIQDCPQCNAALSNTDENCPKCGLRVSI